VTTASAARRRQRRRERRPSVLALDTGSGSGSVAGTGSGAGSGGGSGSGSGMEAVIRRVPIFQGCDAAFIGELREHLVTRVFGEGEFVMAEGELGDEM
jgi:hypothetical protein